MSASPELYRQALLLLDALTYGFDEAEFRMLARDVADEIPSDIAPNGQRCVHCGQHGSPAA